jgi:hypothetical protein
LFKSVKFPAPADAAGVSVPVGGAGAGETLAAGSGLGVALADSLPAVFLKLLLVKLPHRSSRVRSGPQSQLGRAIWFACQGLDFLQLGAGIEGNLRWEVCRQLRQSLYWGAVFGATEGNGIVLEAGICSQRLLQRLAGGSVGAGGKRDQQASS